jgi:hypothetical protein
MSMEAGPAKAIVAVRSVVAVGLGVLAFKGGDHKFDIVQDCHTEITEHPALSQACGDANKHEGEVLIGAAALLEAAGIAGIVKIVRPSPRTPAKPRPTVHA